MKLECGLGCSCPAFRPWLGHEHSHDDTRCTQLSGGISCPGDGKCVEWWRGACEVGARLRAFMRERKARP